MTKALRTFGEDRQVAEAKRRFLGKSYGIGWRVALDVLRSKGLVTQDSDGEWKLVDPQPAAFPVKVDNLALVNAVAQAAD